MIWVSVGVYAVAHLLLCLAFNVKPVMAVVTAIGVGALIVLGVSLA